MISDNNEYSGGAALAPKTKTFATLNDFLLDKKFAEYKEGALFEIKDEQVSGALNKMNIQAKNKYSVLNNTVGMQ